MAKDTGEGSRRGAVENPRTSDYAERNEEKGSPKRGEFMDNKRGGKPFKGVAKERDERRK